MYKDGNKLSIDLLHKQETIERNGVEVLVNVKDSDLNNFADAIKSQLVYFENLYVIDSTKVNFMQNFAREFNDFHIRKYNNFLVNDLFNGEVDLILGKVRYPLRLSSLTKHYPDYIYKYPITLVFDIGDLEVTPNREEILYNSKNIAKIEENLDRAIEEVKEIIDRETDKDYDNVGKYVEALKDTHHVYLMNTDESDNPVKLPVPKKLFNITLNGKSYDEENFLATYNYIIDVNLIQSNYRLKTGRIESSNSIISLSSLKNNFSKIYVSDVSSLNNMSKTYVRETFDPGAIFLPTKRGIKHYYKEYLSTVRRAVKNSSYNSKFSYDYPTVKVILKNFEKNVLNTQRFSNASVPQSYITKKKDEARALRALTKGKGINWKENVNLKKFELGAIADIISKPETISLEKVRTKYRKLTVYGEVGDQKLRDLAYVVFKAHPDNQYKVHFVEVAPTRKKLLENFPNFVNIENLNDVVKYKLLRQIGTAKLILEELPFINKLANIRNLNKISENLYNVIKELSEYSKRHLDTFNSYNDRQKMVVEDVYKMCKDRNYFDESMRATLNSYKESIKKAEVLLLFLDSGVSSKNVIPEDRINLAVDYVLARKLFRPDIKAVVKMKQETVLNKEI